MSARLATWKITADGATPARWMVFLHGILGRGGNWRTFARQLVRARPAWGAVLVDLRAHGDSTSGEAPHTLAACAADVTASLDVPVSAILGHSFGGKVALAYALEHPDLEHVFVLDSTPSARPDERGSESTREILDLLTSAPQPFASREAFLNYVGSHGIARDIAQWLAMNLRRTERDTYSLSLDLAVVRALLDDYFVTDLWPAVESPRIASGMHFVVGGRSGVFDDSDRTRLRALVERMPERVSLDVLADAGHWLHVDDPAGTFACVVDRIAP